MEKELTLRERYEQINNFILATKPQRENLKRKIGEMEKDIEHYKICIQILKRFAQIETTEDKTNIMHTREVVFYSRRIKQDEKDDIQKILDYYSPEKLKITRIVEGDPSVYLKPAIIEVELV